MLTPRVQKPEVSAQQYAVVLVNEEQLNQLIRRPGMRQVNSRFGSSDLHNRYERLKRRTTAAVILLLLVVAGGLAWVFVPQPAMASVFPWSRPAAIPTIDTGASFSVTIASVDSVDSANVAATRVRSLGLPAFTRRSPGKYQVYQAMVGPFASLDEAELAQRRLGALGYRGARLFVDESLRGAPRSERPADASATNPGLLLLGAPDRISLVIELQSEPRQVNSSRPDAATLQIDAGPMATAASPQPRSARIIEQNGPASARPRSSTRMPVSGGLTSMTSQASANVARAQVQASSIASPALSTTPTQNRKPWFIPALRLTTTGTPAAARRSP